MTKLTSCVKIWQKNLFCLFATLSSFKIPFVLFYLIHSMLAPVHGNVAFISLTNQWRRPQWSIFLHKEKRVAESPRQLNIIERKAFLVFSLSAPVKPFQWQKFMFWKIYSLSEPTMLRCRLINLQNFLLGFILPLAILFLDVYYAWARRDVFGNFRHD